jgi:hypothetical protein
MSSEDSSRVLKARQFVSGRVRSSDGRLYPDALGLFHVQTCIDLSSTTHYSLLTTISIRDSILLLIDVVISYRCGLGFFSADSAFYLFLADRQGLVRIHGYYYQQGK